MPTLNCQLKMSDAGLLHERVYTVQLPCAIGQPAEQLEALAASMLRVMSAQADEDLDNLEEMRGDAGGPELDPVPAG
jgi:hypothetical protein